MIRFVIFKEQAEDILDCKDYLYNKVVELGYENPTGTFYGSIDYQNKVYVYDYWDILFKKFNWRKI
jgi:hypothetical protein